MTFEPGVAAASQRASRSANERFEELLDGRTLTARLIPFLCECADPDCLGRVDISRAEYGRIHRDRTLFVIVPGHPLADGEEPTETRDEFDIVRKPTGA
jgi:hypothetical protein